MLNKTVTKVRFDDSHWRWKNKIVSDPCVKNSIEGKMLLAHMFQTFIDQPQILSCGGESFDALKIYHDGTHWVIETEAVVRKESVQ